MNIVPSPYAPGGPIALYKYGKFYVRLEPLDVLTKYEAMAFVMHEGNPGHHLDRTVSKSRKQLPDFIKYPMYDRLSEAPSRVNMPTVYGEGWGLYSEYLGLEMGLYDDPLTKFGYFAVGWYPNLTNL